MKNFKADDVENFQSLWKARKDAGADFISISTYFIHKYLEKFQVT